MLSFDLILAGAARGVGRLVAAIDAGEPCVTIIGHKYPDDLESFLKTATAFQLDFAIHDLEESKKQYHDIVHER